MEKTEAKITKQTTTNETSLAEIYTLGITRTLWKSHMLHKINELRKALDLEARPTALPEGTYDKEVTDTLASMDFSELGTACNAYALTVLTFAGSSLTPVNTGGIEEAPLLGGVEEGGEHID